MEQNKDLDIFHMDIQLFQQHLLKRLAPIGLAWHFNLEINCPYIYDLFQNSLFWCFDLFTYSYDILCVFVCKFRITLSTPQTQACGHQVFYICLPLETSQSRWYTCNSTLVIVIIIKCLLCIGICSFCIFFFHLILMTTFT